jgi:hypothetical protein
MKSLPTKFANTCVSLFTSTRPTFTATYASTFLVPTCTGRTWSRLLLLLLLIHWSTYPSVCSANRPNLTMTRALPPNRLYQQPKAILISNQVRSLIQSNSSILLTVPSRLSSSLFDAKMAVVLHPTGKALAVRTGPRSSSSLKTVSKSQYTSSPTLVTFVPMQESMKTSKDIKEASDTKSTAIKSTKFTKQAAKSKSNKVWTRTIPVANDKWTPMIADQSSSDSLGSHRHHSLQDTDTHKSVSYTRQRNSQGRRSHRHPVQTNHHHKPNPLLSIDESLLYESSPAAPGHSSQPPNQPQQDRLSKPATLLSSDSLEQLVPSTRPRPLHLHKYHPKQQDHRDHHDRRQPARQHHSPSSSSSHGKTIDAKGLKSKAVRPEVTANHAHPGPNRIFSHDVALKFRESTIEEDLKLIKWISGNYDLFSSNRVKTLPSQLMAEQMRNKQHQFFGYPLIDSYSYDHFDKETTHDEKMFEQHAPYQHSANPGLRDMVRRLHQLESSYHERPHWHKFLIKAFLNVVTNPLR